MTGESDLAKLLASLSPSVMDSEFVFLTFPDARYGDYAELKPVAACTESEGLTLIVSRELADEHSLNYTTVLKGHYAERSLQPGGGGFDCRFRDTASRAWHQCQRHCRFFPRSSLCTERTGGTGYEGIDRTGERFINRMTFVQRRDLP